MEVIFEAFIVNVAHPLAYWLGSLAIWIFTLGTIQAEPLSRRDQGDIDTYTLSPRELSQESTLLIGYVVFISLVGLLMYAAYS